MTNPMTFGEIAKLTRESKHKSIGRVTLYVDLEMRKVSKIEVRYKSGKKFTYNHCPDSVRDFLEHYTVFTTYLDGKTQVAIYFMA